jgi:hypothetical protein
LGGSTLKRVGVDGDRVAPVIEVINPFGQAWYDN